MFKCYFQRERGNGDTVWTWEGWGRLGSQRGEWEKESSGNEKAHTKTQLRLKLQKL